jgi:hypothetical protein
MEGSNLCEPEDSQMKFIELNPRFAKVPLLQAILNHNALQRSHSAECTHHYCLTLKAVKGLGN